MNKKLTISLSLLILPIITFCSEKSERKVTFFSRGKAFPTISYTEKNSPEEKNSSPKNIENQNPESSKALSSVAAQSSEPIVRLGISYDLPTTKNQDVAFFPGMRMGYDSKGLTETATSFVHRLINAGKLLDACSKPDKLQSKEPKINERITEALREINLKFNDEQKKAHASVSKLLTEQKTYFTQNTNSMLSILLTLNSIGISQVISGQDVELYTKNIQEEIDSLNKESKMFENEKKAQIAHLEQIKEKLKEHLEVISEKKESK